MRWTVDEPMNRDIVYALGAAALFGASTPLAKWLAGEIPPVLLAGLLYLGSGLGLTLARLVRDGGFKASGLAKMTGPGCWGRYFLAVCWGRWR